MNDSRNEDHRDFFPIKVKKGELIKDRDFLPVGGRLRADLGHDHPGLITKVAARLSDEGEHQLRAAGRFSLITINLTKPALGYLAGC